MRLFFVWCVVLSHLIKFDPWFAFFVFLPEFSWIIWMWIAGFPGSTARTPATGDGLKRPESPNWKRFCRVRWATQWCPPRGARILAANYMTASSGSKNPQNQWWVKVKKRQDLKIKHVGKLPFLGGSRFLRLWDESCPEKSFIFFVHLEFAGVLCRQLSHKAFQPCLFGFCSSWWEENAQGKSMGDPPPSTRLNGLLFWTEGPSSKERKHL